MVDRPVLLVGPVGTGKTSVAQGVLQKLDPQQFNLLTINLSAQVGSGLIYTSALLGTDGTVLVRQCYKYVCACDSQTTANNVQEIIESKVEKRTKGAHNNCYNFVYTCSPHSTTLCNGNAGNEMSFTHEQYYHTIAGNKRKKKNKKKNLLYM